MPPLTLVCNSGALTSPPFSVEQADRRFALEVPSLSVATAVTIQFTQTSGTAPFWPLQKADGSGQIHTITSGPGQAFCLLPQFPTPWGRIAFANSQTAVHTLTLYPVQR